MTPSSTLSKRLSKKPPPKPSGDTLALAEGAVVLEVRSSQTHRRVIAAVALLCLLSPISAHLPWIASIFIWLWTGASLAHLYRRQSSLIALCDNGDNWQLVYSDMGAMLPVRVLPHRLLEVHYENSSWCNAYLILLTFKEASGKTHHISVWRDSVTDAGFSWLAARITLTSPDKKVKTVATSGELRFTHSR